ncbi:uncharacterized protein LOC144074848 [Stigmatopora argus]
MRWNDDMARHSETRRWGKAVGAQAALLLTLLALQWRPAPALPVFNCLSTLSKLKHLTSVLSHETGNLLKEYNAYHGFEYRTPHVPEQAAAANGSEPSELLADAYASSVSFNRSLTKVKEYQILEWDNPKSVGKHLNQVTSNLQSQSTLLGDLIRLAYPAKPVRSTPSPPHYFHDHSFAKKEFGWEQIVGLGDWLPGVYGLLTAGPGPCDRSTEDRR